MKRLVEALDHNIAGPGLDSHLGPGNFLWDLILLSSFSSPGVHLASNGNEYKGIFWGRKVASA